MEEREIFRKLMKKQLEPGDLYDQLRAMKIRATYENAICFQMVKKAAGVISPPQSISWRLCRRNVRL